MKIKNKILSFVLALCLIIPCALVFTACDDDKDPDPTFTVNQNVLTLANDIVDNLTLVYNNSASLGAGQTFTIENIKTVYPTFNYYVNVGTMTEIDDVDSITFGTTKFVDDQTFKLSIGNDNYIQGEAYFEEDDNLYVAAPIIVFETVNLTKIKINNTEFNFDLEVETTASNFTSLTFESGSTNEMLKISDSEYNVNFKDANTYLKLTYANANASDVLLTKKVLSGSQTASVNKVNYGLTTVESEIGNPLAFYPLGYKTSALTQSDANLFDGATMNYSAYVIGGGVYSVTLNYNIDVTAQ